jgi:hypothetical protein
MAENFMVFLYVSSALEWLKQWRHSQQRKEERNKLEISVKQHADKRQVENETRWEWKNIAENSTKIGFTYIG